MSSRCTRFHVIVESTEGKYLKSIFPKSERALVFRQRKMHERSVREPKLTQPIRKCSCSSLPKKLRKQCCAQIVSRIHVPRFVSSGGRPWGALDEHQHQTGAMQLAVCRFDMKAPGGNAKKCAQLGAVAAQAPLSCKGFKSKKKGRPSYVS